MASRYRPYRSMNNKHHARQAPVATDADRVHAKQIIIARIACGFYWDSSMFINLGTNWPRENDVAAFHLDITRGGRAKATVFIIPPSANKLYKTEVYVSSRQPLDDDSSFLPVAQFRQLCFYRIINKMQAWLEEAEPEDDKEVLHFMAIFEAQVKTAMRKRTLTVTPTIEKRWNRYGGVRTLYLQPGTEGEKQAARASIVRIVRAFLTEMKGVV